MRSVCMELNIPRLAVTQVMGKLWSGAYLSRINPTTMLVQPDPPLPGSKSVRVRNRLSLICGSDLHLLFAEADPRIAIAALPSTGRVYLGHEICGEVVEVGTGVSSVQPGDRVALRYPMPTCVTQEIEPQCQACREDNPFLCDNQAAERTAPAIGGGWGDQMVVHESQLYRPPDSLSDYTVAMLEPAAVGVHAVAKVLPRLGRRVLVMGCGVVGLTLIQALAALAPECEVTALARHAFQAEKAKETATGRGTLDVRVKSDGYEVTREKTGAKLYQGGFGSKMLLGGFDTVFDCVGTSATLADCLRWTRAGGSVVAVGIQYRPYKVDLSPLYYQEIQLIGTFGYSAEEWRGERMDAFELVARLAAAGDLKLDGLITHRFPLSDWKEAVRASADKKKHRSIKVALTPDRSE